MSVPTDPRASVVLWNDYPIQCYNYDSSRLNGRIKDTEGPMAGPVTDQMIYGDDLKGIPDIENQAAA